LHNGTQVRSDDTKVGRYVDGVVDAFLKRVATDVSSKHQLVLSLYETRQKKTFFSTHEEKVCAAFPCLTRKEADPDTASR
jgi:autophagy-related ATG101-like protein